MSDCDIIEGHDGEPYCRIHECYTMPDGCPAAIEAESRARAIRAVVAAQWGVACVLLTAAEQAEKLLPDQLDPLGQDTDEWHSQGICDGVADCIAGTSLLPTAEQIVDEVTT
jgi:hypothetical protein